eukprot:4563512-Alexandrium_andersonii.AAC.1
MVHWMVQSSTYAQWRRMALTAAGLRTTRPTSTARATQKIGWPSGLPCTMLPKTTVARHPAPPAASASHA